PLGIVTTLRPVRHIPDSLSISELYVDHEAASRLSAKPLPRIPRNWSDVFLRLDQLLKLYEQAPLKSLRETAMRRAERWLVDHLSDGTEGLGAIFPPMVYLLIVFRLLKYPDDHPTVVAAQQHLKDLMIRDGDTIRLQPCFSPVWDTGIALNAVAETGLGEGDESADRAVDWLLSKECRMASDWRKNTVAVAPGGWFFEFNNPHYPDTDDTAMVARALARTGGKRARAAIVRAVDWLFAMQNDDGGWAAFDKTRDRPLLEKIPFADHNAMQDPSCPDIAARVIEGLGGCGVKVSHPAIKRAVKYLRRTQDPCGAWWGRWGVNFIYGTWQTLCGLKSVGQDMREPWIIRAADWLRSVQKPVGSWGESCASYDDANLKGIGDSTPSQTAWGVMGLMAVVGADDADVRRGIQWLVDRQDSDGEWEERPFTGTGFPRVFYLKYHLYRHYFPLMALARYRRLSGSSNPG
ncbi:MAG: squalene--hopene cyclase, partial [Phycisphaerae bacterium]|nr:squalene--hopene cyclase [Phycisphaerae bacterium]